MEENGKMPKVLILMMTGACFVILVAGMRAAGDILVPFILSLFIAIICAPPLFWMQKKGIPQGLAVLSILVGTVIIMLLMAAFVGASVTDFLNDFPVYQDKLAAKKATLLSWLRGLGLDMGDRFLADYFSPTKAMKWAANALSRLSGLLANVFLILLTVIFILLEAAAFPQKLRAGLKDPENTLVPLSNFTESVGHYISLKTLFSVITGVAISIWLVILGIDHALLWGLTAFLLNYVPNIGSILAAIPAVLMALVQFGTGSALLTISGYLVVNVVVGSFIEPKYMGRGLGLSTLIVFLSLVFWGWVLGPVGMVLSVPLTMIVKIALERSEDTRWIAIVLGPALPDEALPGVKSPGKSS